MALQDNLVLGEGAGLVGAQHVHGAQVLDGVDVLNDHVLARHVGGAAGQAGGHYNGQHLRGDAHRDGDGEQQRIQPVALGNAVHHKDDGAHDQHERHQYARHRRHADVEAGARGLDLQGAGDLAQIGVLAGAQHHGGSRSALHGGAGERDVGAVVDGDRGPAAVVFDLDGFGRLLHGLALAGERRLGHKQVLGGDDAHIGRDHVAGGEFHDVAGHHVFHGDLAPGVPAADHAAGGGHHVLEGAGGALALGLLRVAKNAGDQHHDADDDGGGGVGLAGGGHDHVGVDGDCRQRDKDQRERAHKSRGHALELGLVALLFHHVFAVDAGEVAGELGVKAGHAGVELAKDIIGTMCGGVDHQAVEFAGLDAFLLAAQLVELVNRAGQLGHIAPPHPRVGRAGARHRRMRWSQRGAA